MNIRSCVGPALVLLVLGPGDAVAEPRPPLPAVSAIRAGNYGSPSVLVEAREELRPLLGELNALRRKDWTPGETKISCYATVILLEKGRQVLLYRVRPEVIVERAFGKGQTSYSLPITDADLPRLGKLLAEITPPKCD